MESATHRVPLNTVVLLLAAWVGTAGQAAAKGDQAALGLRANVVQITTRFEERGREWTESGFGFISGSRGGRVVVVTANHVIRGDHPTPDTRTAGIQVRFYGDQGRTYRGELLQVHLPQLDLGVIECDAPAGLSWRQEALDDPERIRRGTAVWFIGRGGRWHVPTSAGRVNDAPLLGQFAIDDLDVRRGTSGAPVVTDRGIVGMVLQDDGQGEVKALTIEEIQRAFARWNEPWQLRLASEVEAPTPIGPGPEGIVAEPPPTPSPAVDLTGRWQFQMGTNLFGQFVPTGAGFFDFVPSGPGLYTYTQYTAMGVPESAGTARVEEEVVFVEGSGQLLGPYTAALEVAGLQLAGSLFVQGQEMALVLSR